MQNLYRIILVLLFSSVAQAAPFNLSLIPDVALVDKSDRVEGVSIGIWSENPQTALALGVVNGSSGKSQGVSLALLGNYAENYTGAHVGLVNWSQGHFTGLQFGTVNFAKKLTGVQIGFINYAETVVTGVQIGLINVIAKSTWFDQFPNSLAPVFPFVNWSFR